MSKFSESSKNIFPVVAFLICTSCYSQFSDTAYVRTFGGPGMDMGRDIQSTADRGFIIVGTTSSCGMGNTAAYLIKTDSLGNHQWSKAIGGAGIEWGYSVKQTFDGGYAAAGYTNSFGNGGYDMYLVKTDSDGNTLWEKSYGGSDWDFGYCVQQTPDSGFVICGETYSYGNGSTDAFLVCTDKTGDTLWTRTAGGDSIDAAYSITIYNDSIYAFAGETNSSGKGGSDMFFGTFDKQGNIFSSKTFGTTKNDKGYWIEKSMDGNFLIFGETDSTTTNKASTNELLLKIDSNGGILWSQLHGNNGIDIGRAVKEKSNGDLITCGTTNSSGSGGNALHMMMLNSGGWWLSGPAFGATEDEKGYALAISPKNEIAFVGTTTSYGQGLEDVYIIILKKDSIVMEYTLDINQYNDTTCSPLSIAEYEIENNTQVYPNPFTESASVMINNWQNMKIKIAELKIYDAFGKVTLKSEMRNNESEIKRGNLNAGIYFYSVTSENEIISQGKFVIR